jgi:hypothetical protein
MLWSSAYSFRTNNHEYDNALVEGNVTIREARRLQIVRQSCFERLPIEAKANYASFKSWLCALMMCETPDETDQYSKNGKGHDIHYK